MKNSMNRTAKELMRNGTLKNSTGLSSQMVWKRKLKTDRERIVRRIEFSYNVY